MKSNNKNFNNTPQSRAPLNNNKSGFKNKLNMFFSILPWLIISLLVWGQVKPDAEEIEFFFSLLRAETIAMAFSMLSCWVFTNIPFVKKMLQGPDNSYSITERGYVTNLFGKIFLGQQVFVAVFYAINFMPGMRP